MSMKTTTKRNKYKKLMQEIDDYLESNPPIDDVNAQNYQKTLRKIYKRYHFIQLASTVLGFILIATIITTLLEIPLFPVFSTFLEIFFTYAPSYRPLVVFLILIVLFFLAVSSWIYHKKTAETNKRLIQINKLCIHKKIPFEQMYHLNKMKLLDEVLADDTADRATLVDYLEKSFNYYKTFPNWKMIVGESAFLIIFLLICFYLWNIAYTATQYDSSGEGFNNMAVLPLMVFLIVVGPPFVASLLLCIRKITEGQQMQEEVKEKIFLLEEKINQK
ncbi:MAG: DUF4231 domain-containing protein [Eubacterium sp.]|nr:DUF4231 domain-containing protein [Eubacterium sp.]